MKRIFLMMLLVFAADVYASSVVVKKQGLFTYSDLRLLPGATYELHCNIMPLEYIKGKPTQIATWFEGYRDEEVLTIKDRFEYGGPSHGRKRFRKGDVLYLHNGLDYLIEVDCWTV